MDRPVLLDVYDAATYLGVSPRTLNGWRSRGGGPAFLKLGALVRYRQADLDAWLSARVRRSTSDRGPEVTP